MRGRCWLWLFPVAFGAANARLYMKSRVEPEDWITHLYKQHDTINSTIECGGMCDVDPDCAAFKFSQSGVERCQLAKERVLCEVVQPGEHSGTAVDFHAPVDVGSGLGGGRPVLLTSAADKAGWSASSPSVHPGTALAWAVNGDYATRFGSKGHACPLQCGQGEHQWLQVRLDREYWVRGAHIGTHPEAIHHVRMRFQEVRVGNDEFPVSTSQNSMLCQNHLCFMTGNEDAEFLYSDCANVVKGRVVTVQVYDGQSRGGAEPSHYLDVAELDLSVVCGRFGANDVPCVPEQPDMCYNRANLAVGAVSPATADDRQSWTVTTSSSSDDASVDVLVDGVTEGTLADGTAFGTETFEEGDKLPWVQIDLGEVMVVKAVRLYTESVSPYENMLYSEVRVGNANMGTDTATGTRFCQNPACKQTGGGDGRPSDLYDCLAGPLEGRFVTVQRYDYKKDDTGEPIHSALVLSEIEIEFYR